MAPGAAPPLTASPEARPAGGAPSLVVILVNFDGAEHLPACLDSLADQDYPRHLTEVLVVDNGSTDGSLELLAREYPWAKVLAQDRNLGFAPAVDLGARTVDSDCIVLLNNDMRVAPDWLSELVRSYDPEHGVTCVGGQILNWDGSTVDFVRAAMNFGGMGFQVGFGRARDSVAVEDGHDLLFACGGSMLVQRDTYLEVGGFDPGFFAYLEDVDFGWRLWVLGHQVKLAAKALSYHRHHGTAARFPEHQRVVLLERNALRSMIKNYDDENLAATLGPALLLLVRRAVLRGGLDRAPYHIGADARVEETVPRTALAHLHAVSDVVDDLPRLLADRERIQHARRRSDTEVFERFGHPFEPVMDDTDYLEAQEKVVTGFSLDRRFDRQRAKRLLVVDEAPGDRGPTTPGRALEMARALASTAEVTVAVPRSDDGSLEGCRVVGYQNDGQVRELAQTADVVLLASTALRHHRHLAGVQAVLVADLGDPGLYGGCGPDEPTDDLLSQEGARLVDGTELNRLLDDCDFFLCASHRQRDHLVNVMVARGLLHESSDDDRRDVVDVVPSLDGGDPRESDVTEPLRRVLAQPWRWQRARLGRGRKRILTDDLRVLLERRMQQVRDCQEEAGALRARLVEVEARLEQLERRLAVFRRTPAYPIFRLAKRTRQWAKRFEP